MFEQSPPRSPTPPTSTHSMVERADSPPRPARLRRRWLGVASIGIILVALLADVIPTALQDMRERLGLVATRTPIPTVTVPPTPTQNPRPAPSAPRATPLAPTQRPTALLAPTRSRFGPPLPEPAQATPTRPPPTSRPDRRPTPGPPTNRPTATPALVVVGPSPTLPLPRLPVAPPTATAAPAAAAPPTPLPARLPTAPPVPEFAVLPTLPPPSFNNCQADSTAEAAPGYPVRIVYLDKRSEIFMLQNVSREPVDLHGWIMCSIGGGQQHDRIGVSVEGTGIILPPGEGRYFTFPGGNIWDDTARDDAALYNTQGQLVSYRADQ